MPDEQYTRVAFYIVAHADDWQLFMHPNAYNDLIANSTKVIFIITTAGDAGVGKKYWAAREEGTKSSVRFCLAPLAAPREFISTRKFDAHTINYWSGDNATCYFLRLPDGNLDGSGFSLHDYRSLSRLRAGQINTIAAIDNSTMYYSWSDFCTTLQTIISYESQGFSNIWINYINPDTGANPNDHADHIATGQAIQATTITSGFQQALYVGYNVNNTSENLDKTDLFWKAGMFAAYEKAVFDGSGYSTLHEGIPIYLNWCLSSAKFITVNKVTFTL